MCLCAHVMCACVCACVYACARAFAFAFACCYGNVALLRGTCFVLNIGRLETSVRNGHQAKFVPSSSVMLCCVEVLQFEVLQRGVLHID